VIYGAVPNGGLLGLGYVYSYDPSNHQLTDVCDLYNSSGTYGYQPISDVTVAANPMDQTQNVYGTTQYSIYGGGHLGTGTVFQCNPQTHIVASLHLFGTQAGADRAWNPGAPVMVNGKLYGTDYNPGGLASVYSYDFTSSTFTDIFYFGMVANGGSAGAPGGLTYFAGGLYGVTPDGGVNSTGSIFRLDGY